VYSFHIDTNNLPKITPPWIKVTLIAIEPSTVTLDIRRFGITTRWKMAIEKLNCPYTLVDVMLQGPFSFFRHERRFIPLSTTTTRMDETLTIALPLRWLGTLAFWWVKRDMDTMFAYRHTMTQHYCLGGENVLSV
jgi:ligand-binding SRPBCC domain-containing protein